MSIFSVFTLLGGLALFLYGMNVMSDGLEKTAGGKLEQILRKMTDNRFKGFLLGLGVTAAIQSSSALTVMLVGLVNSGIMKFSQTIGAIMGSNIGTTVTSWILSLAGLESDTFFLKLLKPANFSMIFALIGVILISFTKSEKKKSAGSILVGFAVLMTGMTLMSDATEPLSEMPQFVSVLTAFNNPLLGVVVGALFTALIQSSSASVGILQALAVSGGITYGMAIPIIMGQNIGTCITAIISSIGVSRNAKKVSVVHLCFNIIGTSVWLGIFLIANAMLDFAFINTEISPFMIAVVHSIFNVLTTALLLPFGNQLEKIANRIIKEEETVEIGPKLDARLFTMPALATASAFDHTVDMAHLSFEAFRISSALVTEFSEKNAEKVKELEETIDIYEDRLGTYMVKLSRESISVEDSHQVAKILHAINDFERMGDHACNLVKVGREISEKNIVFSESAQKELAVLHKALLEITALTERAFCENDVSLAIKVEPLEQVIDRLIYKIKTHHVTRLQQGDCTIQLGFVLSDLVTNYERVSDHCSNVAATLIEAEHDSLKTHEYLRNFKSEENEVYKTAYEEYKNRFSL